MGADANRFVSRRLLTRTVAFRADSAGAAGREQGRDKIADSNRLVSRRFRMCKKIADANRFVSRRLLTRTVAFRADSAGAAGREQGRDKIADSNRLVSRRFRVCKKIADANRCVSRGLLMRTVPFLADSAGAAGREQG
jgi:hypothetical protein